MKFLFLTRESSTHGSVHAIVRDLEDQDAAVAFLDGPGELEVMEVIPEGSDDDDDAEAFDDRGAVSLYKNGKTVAFRLPIPHDEEDEFTTAEIQAMAFSVSGLMPMVWQGPSDDGLTEEELVELGLPPGHLKYV